jgi:CubicO group peptidase (beta-lactamase class C family)
VPLARSLAEHQPARVRPVGTSGDGLSSSYSNWATSLAGLIVANVSGVSFEDYVETNILRPLGMESSTFREPLPEALEKRMSVGYTYEAGAFKPHGYEFIANFRPRRLAGRHRPRHGPLHDRAPPGRERGRRAHPQGGERPGDARAHLQPPTPPSADPASASTTRT